MQTLARRLGVDPGFAIAGYEDVWYYLWRERRLPVNVDPFDSRLENPEDRRAPRARLRARARHRRRLRAADRARRSGAWHRPALAERPLVPPARAHVPDAGRLADGLSPAARLAGLGGEGGLSVSDRRRSVRAAPPLPLPLGAHHAATTDPAAVRRRRARDLPARRGLGDASARALADLPPDPGSRPPTPSAPPSASSRATASCTSSCRRSAISPTTSSSSPRSKRRRPSSASRCSSRATIRRAIHGSGSSRSRPTPASSRSTCIRRRAGTSSRAIPASSTRRRASVASAPRSSCSTARHTGTGGGNHLTLGGASAADSPILRRPDLLRSLLAYWHNHPSLSFTFSGLFIGPTSQAPRVDEARNDQLYELETAFRAGPGVSRRPAVARRSALPQPPGRRHRQHASHRVLHRQALLARLGARPARHPRAPELRDAAARPHEPRAAAAGARARGALLGRSPTRRRLVRWGTELHDRFMLPHFVAAGPRRRPRRARAGRLPVRRRVAGAAPRVPLPGDRIDRRSAASRSSSVTRSSPGTCSARRTAAAGTVRSVDSSLERLQVKVSGMVDGRHVLTCNGHTVPLHPTGTNGEYVAGVRYRAWCPPSALHPTIPIHTPLVFDLVDTWSRRSIGGCTAPRRAPGRTGLRHLPGERLRGRGPPGGAILPVRAYAGEHEPHARRSRSRVPVHARPAAEPDGASIRTHEHDVAVRRPARRRGSPSRLHAGRGRVGRDAGRARRAASALDPGGPLAPRARPERAGTALGARPASDPRERRHLQRLRRPARHAPAVGARRRAAGGVVGRVGAARARARAARPLAEPRARGPLRPAAPACATACCRPSSSTRTRRSSDPVTASRSRRHRACTSTPPTSRARPTGASG